MFQELASFLEEVFRDAFSNVDGEGEKPRCPGGTAREDSFLAKETLLFQSYTRPKETTGGGRSGRDHFYRLSVVAGGFTEVSGRRDLSRAQAGEKDMRVTFMHTNDSSQPARHPHGRQHNSRV